MEIPRVALGTYLMGDCDAPIMHALTKANYKHIDCAEFYQNEKEVGDALAKVFATGQVKREDIWITSKIWNHHHYKGDAGKYCRETLKKLQVDYLDLYLIHWPCTFAKTEDDNPMPRDSDGKIIHNYSVSVLDMWAEMEQLVEEGLVKHIGVSNFSIEMLERMRFDPRVKIQPYCVQVEYNLYMQQEALRMYCEFRGMYMEGYSPLGTSGWAKSGKPNLLADPVLNAVASELGKTPAQVELKFLLQISPKTVVLPKSTNPERIALNNSLDFELSDDQISRLKACERCQRYVDGHSMGFSFADDY